MASASVTSGPFHRGRGRLIAAFTIALIAVVVVALASRLTAVGRADGSCTVTWTGSVGDGLWTTAGNWSGGAVPGSSDVVCIPSGDTVSVESGDSEADSVVADGATLDVEGGSLTLGDSGSNSTLGVLDLSGGQFDVDGALVLGTALDWTEGTLGGSGLTEVSADATGSVNPAGSLGLGGQELVNAGTTTFDCRTADDPTDMYSVIAGTDSAAVINTGTLTLEGSCAFQQADSTVDALINYGSLQASGEQAVGWAMTSGDESQTTIVANQDYGGDLALYGGDSDSPLAGDWGLSDPQFGNLELAAGGTYEFTTDSQNSTNMVVDSSPEIMGDADFVAWLTGETLAPSLDVGDVSWPDATIGAEGPVTIGDGSAVASVGALYPEGWTGEDGVATLIEPDTDPSNTPVITQNAEAEEGGVLNLSGYIEAPDAYVAAEQGTVNFQGSGNLEYVYSDTWSPSYPEPQFAVTGSITAEYLEADGGGEWFGPGQITTTDEVDSGDEAIFDGLTVAAPNGYDLDDGPTFLLDNTQIELGSYINMDGGWFASNGPDPGTLHLARGITDSCDSPTYVGPGIGVDGTDPNNCLASDPDSSAGWGLGNPAAPYTPDYGCGEPVMCASGDQTEVETDLSMGGRGGSFQLTRVYNSQDTFSLNNPGMFGAGWTSSYTDHLSGVDSQGDVSVQAANGSTSYFSYDSSTDTYTPVGANTASLSFDFNAERYTYVLPNGETQVFNEYGYLVSDTTRSGLETTLTYGGHGYGDFQLTTITAPSGRQIQFTYNADGFVATATDSDGQVVYYGYDNNQDLVSVTYGSPDATPRWQFGYDPWHELTSLTDGNGNTDQISYQGGLVTSQTDAAGNTRTWAYDPDDATGESETLVTSPAGNVTQYLFDASGNPISVTEGYGTSAQTTTSYTYNAAEEPVAVTDGNGNTSTYTYDAAGDQTSASNGLGETTTWTYDSYHDPLTMTLPSGLEWEYTYSDGRLATATENPAGGSLSSETATYTYDSAGDLTSVEDPMGHTTSYAYDGEGDVTSETDSLGNTTSYAYDGDGRVVSEVAPEGNVSGADPLQYTTSYTYNQFGELTSETDPLGNQTSYTYDGDGNLASVTDANGNTTTYAYTPDEQVQSITDPAGDVTTYDYDQDGNVESSATPNGDDTWYFYTPLDQLAGTEQAFLGNSTTSDTYDLDGNLASYTDANGQTTDYTYDAADQLIETTEPGTSTPATTYDYTSDGLRSSMTDATGTSTYSYDGLDRLSSETDGNGDTISYGYNADNETTSIEYPNGSTVDQGFNADGLLSSVTDWLGNETQFSYTPDSQLSQIAYPSSTSDVDTFDYDRADELTGISMMQNTTTLASVSYDRTATGQIGDETDTGLPGPTSTSYTYDSDERLSAVDSAAYSYDPDGNPTEQDGVTGYDYNAADELTSSPTTTYDYDDDGERTSQTTGTTTTNYSYDAAGTLGSVTDGSNPTDSYAYNGDGQLETSTTSGTTTEFTWDDNGPLPKLLSDGSDSYIYGPNNLPIEQIAADGTVSYLHHDGLGSTRLITDTSGDAAGTVTYNASGTLNASSGTATTVLGYAGDYTDPNTGLQYDQARWYDPDTSSFLTVDPLVADTDQPYIYADDDPINNIDPTGQSLWSLFKKIVVAEAADVGCGATSEIPGVDAAVCDAAADADADAAADILGEATEAADVADEDPAVVEAEEEEAACIETSLIEGDGDQPINDPFAGLRRPTGPTMEYMSPRSEVIQKEANFLDGLSMSAGTNPDSPAVPSGAGGKLASAAALLSRLFNALGIK